MLDDTDVVVKPAEEKTGSSEKGSYRALEVDHYIRLRIRARRIMLGLTQQQMAELIGVTYQQAHKYESGINRISASRLYQIARALGVDISYFFEEVEPESFFEEVEPESGATRNHELVPQHPMLLELARNFIAIQDRKRQEEVCALVRALAERDHGAGHGSNPQTFEIAAPIKFLMKLMETWAIDERGLARLLGFEDEEVISKLLSGAATLDSRDMKDRVRHLLRMREALHSLFRDPNAEREWLREPRPELNGQTPLALLLEGSMEKFLVVSQVVQWMVGR